MARGAGVAFLTILSICVGSRSVQAIASCAACPATTLCLLDGTATPMTPGESSLALKVCNWDAAKAAAMTLDFSLKHALPCDPNGVLLPNVTALRADAAACSAASCVVHAALTTPLDWALGTNGNTLLAKLKGPSTSPEVVPIATSAPTDRSSSGGVISAVGDASSAPLTVCSSTISVTGERLSTLKACNAVVMCLGKAGDKTCAANTVMDSAAGVDNVTCDDDKCTGQVPLAKPFACDAASAAVLLNVRVGNAAASAFTNLGSIANAPKASISGVDQLTTGSSSLLLHTDASCPAAALQLQMAPLKVASIAPSSLNGTLAVYLSESISASHGNQKLSISLSQCGVAAASYAATVDHARSEAGATNSTTTDIATTPVLAGNGAVSTQKRNDSTGLHGGSFIALAAAVVAVCGFLYECVRTRRSYKRALAYVHADDAMIVTAC